MNTAKRDSTGPANASQDASPVIDLIRTVTGAVEDFRLGIGSCQQRKLTIVIHENAGIIKQVEIASSKTPHGRFR